MGNTGSDSMADPRLGLVLGAISAIAVFLASFAIIMIGSGAAYVVGGLLAAWGMVMALLFTLEATGARS